MVERKKEPSATIKLVGEDAEHFARVKRDMKRQMRAVDPNNTEVLRHALMCVAEALDDEVEFLGGQDHED